MIWDYLKENDEGLISFKTFKPLVFIRYTPGLLRPWAVFVLSMDRWIDYGEAWYYQTNFRSYPKARHFYNDEIINFESDPEFESWPVK